MPNRGNNRGRGRGQNFRGNRESVHERLGKPVTIYPKAANTKTRYKFVRQTTLTSSLASLPGDARIKMLSKKFLKSYYEIFDRPGRANLDTQYSSDAFFSISSTMPMPTFGRNLLHVQPENRVSLLVYESTNIARTLASSFSPTEHLVDQLTIDIPFYIATPMSVISMHIVVTGVFKDTNETTNPLKAFNRVFILKLVSVDQQGEPVYHIFNDLFMLQPPTPDQIKQYHRDAQITKRLSNTNQQNRANTSATGEQASARGQESILQSIMTKTRMNKVGSRKLLEECDWDENKSMEAFNILFADNKIPQEYFTP